MESKLVKSGAENAKECSCDKFYCLVSKIWKKNNASLQLNINNHFFEWVRTIGFITIRRSIICDCMLYNKS